MSKEVILEYEVDYEKAQQEAEKLAQEIVKDHSGLEYRVFTWAGEGAYIQLFGEDEELVRGISESLSDKKLELLLAGTPVYVIYGGRERPSE